MSLAAVRRRGAVATSTSTSTSRSRPAVRRSGGSPRCAGCAACTTGRRPATARSSSTSTPPPGVRRDGRRDDPLVGGRPAPDRPGRAQVDAIVHRSDRGSTVPAGRRRAPPTIRVADAERALGVRHCSSRSARNAEAVVIVDHTRQRRATRRTSRSCVGDGARLTLVSIQDWDDGRGPRRPPARSAVGRDATLRATST